MNMSPLNERPKISANTNRTRRYGCDMNSEQEQQYYDEPNGSSISGGGGLEMVFLPYFESLEDLRIAVLAVPALRAKNGIVRAVF